MVQKWLKLIDPFIEPRGEQQDVAYFVYVPYSISKLAMLVLPPEDR